MQKLTKEQLRNEAKQQTNAMKHLANWLRNLLLFAVLTAVFAWWGMNGAGIRFGIGVLCIVAAVVCALLAAIVGYGIRRGRRNVKNLLLEAEK